MASETQVPVERLEELVQRAHQHEDAKLHRGRLEHQAYWRAYQAVAFFRSWFEFTHRDATVHAAVKRELDEAMQAFARVSACDRAPRYERVWCSQCGREFGPRDSGFSSCGEHAAEEGVYGVHL